MKSLKKPEIFLRKNRETETLPEGADSLSGANRRPQQGEPELGARAYEFGPFVLNVAERVLLREGERVALTPKAFETLLALVENGGHIVQKEALIKRVWPDSFVQEDNLTFNISALRKALGGSKGGQQYIKTEHKLGYRFVAPVRILADSDGAPVATDTGAFAGGGSVEGGSSASSAAALQGGDPVTRPAPAEESAGCGPPSPPRGRGIGQEEGVPRTVVWVGLGLALLLVAAGTVWLAMPAPEPKVLKCDQITADGREKGEGLATDGERVYLVEQSETGWVIAQVSASGGDPVPMAGVPTGSSITGISHDHRELLVIEGAEFKPGALVVIPLLGGEPRPLGNIRAFSASWSPDGATLAYSTDSGVYLCAPDGANPRCIVPMTGRIIEVHWSADGGKLCFARSEHAQDSLWIVDRDGKNLTRVVPGAVAGLVTGSGLWAPNGEYLIAQSLCAGYSMPAAVRLPSGPFGGRWGQPACLGFGPLEIIAQSMSPDGGRLFGLTTEADRPELEAYESVSRQFRPFLSNISAHYADFSKDGERIAYVAGEKDLVGPDNLWVSQIDGSHKLQITKPPLLTQYPRWSPDGKWIAFMGKDPGQPWRVRVVSAEGGSYEPVTKANNSEGAPTWSPDGTQVAFGGMTQPAEKTTGQLVIHMLNLKTGQLTKVPGSEGLWTARWSPDGRYLAALTEDSRNLMLLDIRSARWTKLAAMAQIPDVVWSRHEEAIYFNGGPRPGDRAIFRAEVPGGRVERLASLTGRSGWDWLGLTPDDCPLVARNVVTNEVYALTVKWP